MSKFWRWITPVAVAGGLAAGVAATPVASASTTATSITINATSPNYPGLRPKDHGLVDGHAIVVYQTKKADRATISGKVTTTATNDTAQLLAKPFGAKAYSALGTPVALTPLDGVASYSFSVMPSLATEYKVQLAGTDSTASGVVTVYVTTGGRAGKPHTTCTRTTCTFSLRIYTRLPASAYQAEVAKHPYLYQAVGYPRLPKDYTLSKTAKASKPTKVNSGEYWQTLTFYIPLRHGSAFWDTQACVRDTESKDGLGLPGHHGCGAKHVSRSAIYLG